MNNFKITTFAIAMGLVVASCEESEVDNYEVEPIYPTFSAPDWKTPGSGESKQQGQTATVFESTMTAYVVLPDSLSANADSEDQMAVYVGDDYREPVTRLQLTPSVYLWIVLIHGNDGEQLTFKYYSKKKKYMYQTATPIPFVADERYGNLESPKVLSLSVVTTK